MIYIYNYISNIAVNMVKDGDSSINLCMVI